jgi:hypothetical protein
MKSKIVNYIGMLLLVCGLAIPVLAQTPSNLSLKYLGFTIHPKGDRTANLQPYKLDPKAHFVVNFGGALGYERFILQDVLSLKLVQAVFLDCSAGLASVTFASIRANFVDRGRHRASMGFGPALMIRQSWERLPDYKSSGYMNTGYLKPFGAVQWKLFPYGVEFEYDCRISKRLDFSVSLTPGLPMAVTMGAGLKYWVERDYKEKVFLPRMKRGARD